MSSKYRERLQRIFSDQKRINVDQKRIFAGRQGVFGLPKRMIPKKSVGVKTASSCSIGTNRDFLRRIVTPLPHGVLCNATSRCALKTAFVISIEPLSQYYMAARKTQGFSSCHLAFRHRHREKQRSSHRLVPRSGVENVSIFLCWS